MALADVNAIMIIESNEGTSPDSPPCLFPLLLSSLSLVQCVLWSLQILLLVFLFPNLSSIIKTLCFYQGLLCVLLFLFLDNEMWLPNVSRLEINSKQWFLLILDHGTLVSGRRAFQFFWREKRLIGINTYRKHLFLNGAKELRKAYDFARVL